MTRLAVATLCVLSIAAAGLAVKPATWVHHTAADLAAGELDKTVVTSLGEVMLARALETLLAPREDLGLMSALAVDEKGQLFLAAAPSSKLYRLEQGKLVEFAELPGVLVRSLSFVKGRLVAGTAGKDAGIYQIDARGKVEKLWADPKVSSVWAVLPGPDGSFYAATGAEGKVYRVAADGQAEVIYDSDEKNILCLAAGAEGLLYAGTSEEGLILEIDPARRAGRVLYDAAEKEVSCLLVDAEGTLYAATADPGKAGPDGEQPSDDVKGRPAAPTPTRPAEESARLISMSGKTLYRGPATPEVMEAYARKDYQKLEEMWKEAGGEVEQAATAPAGGDAGATSAPSTRPTAPSGAATRPSGGAPGPRQAGPRVIVSKGPQPPGPSRPPGPPGEAEGQGNAVYRIDRQGFVRPVFRRPVTILDMALRDGVLVLATGHGGQIFGVNLADDRITVLAKVDPKDVMSLAAGAEGKLYLGTAGQAGVFALGREFAGKGTCISKVLDAKQVSGWGTLSVLAELPPDCSATIATRSGNVEKPDEKTWSSWSAEVPVSSRWTAIGSPAGRFLQYRLTLSGKGPASPVVQQVQIVYQADNLAPVVAAVQVLPSAKPAPARGEGEEAANQPLRYRIVAIKAADPNGDELRYELHYRRLGDQRWIKLTDKLTQPTYPWDTLATADGSYEVRVTVSDDRSNPAGRAQTAARISRPLIVDNTAPTVTDLTVKPAGKGAVSLAAKLADATSRIEKIEYSVDTNEDWTVVAPADGICDSQRESFATTIADLEPGTHRVAVRVTDEYNNIGYASVEVTVEK